MDKLKNEKFPQTFTGTNTSICSTIRSSRLSSVPREKNIREGREEGLKIGREEGKALG